jgi:hypothetical protein
MIDLSLSPFVEEGFSIRVSATLEAITMTCAGNGGMDATRHVQSYLTKLHAEAVRLGVREVVVDFRELYFLTSSCLKCFASWLAVIMKMPREQYRVRFLTNHQLHWQRRSLEALRYFAPRVVDVQEGTRA